MNIFFAPPPQIHDTLIELKGQEARHASQVLRYQKGDSIAIVDGQGTYYEGTVQTISKEIVKIGDVQTVKHEDRPKGRLAVGIIKKRSRLEFIAEKAVEIGIRELIFFQAERSVKQNVRRDRLEAATISAMKQSQQAWLPNIQLFDSLEEILSQYPNCSLIAARQSAGHSFSNAPTIPGNPLMLIGPEGGFSPAEISLLEKNNSDFISLSQNRLRTETAALSMLIQYQFCSTM